MNNIIKRYFFLTLFILTFQFVSLNDVFAQATNSNCASAISLGSFGAAGACPSGTGTPVSYNLTNIGAVPENPYISISSCTGGTQASPAADVWYTFTSGSPYLNVNITGGLLIPNIAIYRGTCGDLEAINCAVGAMGSLTATLGNVTNGQTYYMQISGGDETDLGDFTLQVTPFQSCEDCVREHSFTADPPPTNGTYMPGTTVNFCYRVTNYNQTNTNWMHGVVPTFGSGWNMASLSVSSFIPPMCSTVPSSNSSAGWYWGTTSGLTGYFYDANCTASMGMTCTNYAANGNLGDNYGENCSGMGSPLWEWCWTITASNSCVEGAPLTIGVTTYGDGETGSWSSPACSSDPTWSFDAVMTCCPFPEIASTPTCTGLSTGTATATGLGTSPFTYNWTGPSGFSASQSTSGSSTQTGLAAGTYTVTVTDNNSCVRIMDIVVATTPPPAAPTAVNNSRCGTGTVNLSATGCAGTLNWYDLASGGTLLYSGSTFTTPSISATTTYYVSCVDICESARTPVTATINNLNVTANPTAETCENANNGSISVSSSGGTPGYNVSWSGASSGNPAGTEIAASGGSYTITGLNPGAYTVSVTDAASCLTVVNTTIDPGIIITPNIAPLGTNQCLQGNSFSFNGSGSTISSGSITSYTWNFGDGNNGSGATTTHTYATAGNFTVTLTVSDGTCSNQTTASLVVYPNPTVALTPTNPTCAGFNNGAILATPAGGTATYSYNWSSGANGTGASHTATGLLAGTYTLTVQDANLCPVTATATLVDPSLITVTTSVTNPSCAGLNDGTATVFATGGAGGYTYAWSNFQNTTTATGLLANTFNVTVTDANLCTTVTNATLVDPSFITVTPTILDASCGNADGSVSVVAYWWCRWLFLLMEQ
jgi:PKD repeat protein